MSKGTALCTETYCSKMPSTLRPRSFTSRLIRRASIKSESHCTNIYNKGFQACVVHIRIITTHLEVIQHAKCRVVQGQDTLN